MSRTPAPSPADVVALRAADAEARRRAQTCFDRPLVLEAGAGTGKTATLVARVVAWAMGPGWARARRDLADQASGPPRIDEIAARALSGVVAITFTEAAAAEMAERIGHGLLEVAAGRPPVGLLDEALPADPAVRTERAEALLVAVDQLEVRTIHGWCTSLLQAHALAAGLHPRFSVDAEGDQREEIVAEEVERALHDAFAGDTPDPDLLALAAEGIGPAALAASVRTWVEAGRSAAELAADPLAPAHTAALRRRAVADLQALHAGLAPLEEAGRVVKSLHLRRRAGELAAVLAAPDADLLGGLEDLAAEYASTLTSLARGRLNKTEEAALGALSSEVREAADRLRRLARDLAGVDPEALGRIQRVLVPVVERVEARLRRDGVLAFADLLARAVRLLEQSDAVRDQVRADMRQLLVDEFQDTDPRQCSLVRRLALDGDPADRPGLFIVGDPKQSIYGWRSADLAAYDAFVAEVLAAGGEKASLQVNFRSVPAVLSAVTGAIAPVMIPEVGRQPAYQALIPAPHKADEAGHVAGAQRPVELWATWAWDGPEAVDHGAVASRVREAEARAVAADVVALADQGVPWRDVAVLFRASTELPTLVAALRDAGVPYAVERDRSYFQRREVADAAALVSVVADPHDHLSLVAWMRSTAVGVPDAALLPLWRAGVPGLLSALEGPEHDALAAVDLAVERAAAEVAPLSREFPGLAALAGWPAALRDGVRRIAGLRRSLRRDAADRFVAALRRDVLLEATEGSRYLGAWRLANLDRFFRQLAEALAEGADVQRILRQLQAGLGGRREAEEGRPQEAAEDAVQLMTIHKSKGLGFPHVYVVGLDRQSRRLAPGPDVVEDGGEDGGENGGEGSVAWRLLGQDTPAMVRHRLAAGRVERAEAVRLLYVAMTRAKDRLVLTGGWPASPTPTSPDLARSGAELLAAWEAVPEDLGDLAVALSPDEDHLDRAGVRWRFPGRRPGPPTPRRAAEAALETPPVLAPLARVREDAARLAEAREAARQRMARPWSLPVSGLASHEAAPAPDDQAPARRLPAAPPAVVRAAGTLVHGVLERLDLDLLAAEGLGVAVERAAATLDARARAVAPPALAADAAGRARAILDHMGEGPLGPRLQALASQVRGREVDLLLPPGASAAVGALVGSLDLLYEDPEDGALVVVDYKTDDLPAGSAALRERAAAYAPQLAAYVDAVTQAVEPEVPPRAELWFLLSGEIVRA